MKELSLNILDVASNSFKADAKNIIIELSEAENVLTIRVLDDGCGMEPEFLKTVFSPFTTQRTTRKVGLGLPLLKMAAEATGGTAEISSLSILDHPKEHGTEVYALFYTDHIDCPPLGNVTDTILLLIQRLRSFENLKYIHRKNGKECVLDTRLFRRELGEEIPLSEPEVLSFIKDYLLERETALL